MKIIPSMFVAAFLCLAVSCTSGAKETEAEKSSVNVEVPESTEPEVYEMRKDQEIELDNGKKWKVNPEMMVHVRNIENDMKVFSKDKSTATDADYKALAGRIGGNIDNITKSCTMTGKSHDELHKWLLPFIDHTKKLTKASGVDESSVHFNNLQASLTEFNRYFE
jgi:hypothetical protein